MVAGGITVAALTAALAPTIYYFTQMKRAQEEAAESQKLLNEQTAEFQKKLTEISDKASAEKMLSGYQKYILDLLISLGKVKEAAQMLQELGVNSPAIAGAKDYKKTTHDIDEENKSELDQAVDKANEKFAERLEKIAAGRDYLISKYKAQIIGDSTVPRTPEQLQQDQLSASVSAAMDIDQQFKAAANARDAEIKKANIKEQTEEQELLNRAVEQELEIDSYIAELDKQIAEDKKRQTAEAEKLAQVQEELARSAAQVKLKRIQDNPFLTNYEKGQQSIPALQGLMAANQTDISAQSSIASNTGTDSASQIARSQALTKINELMLQQVELQHQLDAAENQDSFSYQLGEVIVKLQNVGTVAQQAAQVFGSVWTTATDSMTKNFAAVIEETPELGPGVAEHLQKRRG